jgi:hypothetical protein
MNETQDSTTTGAEQEAAGEDTAARKNVFDVIGDALKKGKADATEAAQDAIPKMKKAVETGAYKGAYGAAFGFGFSLAVLKELVPQSVVDGMKSGAQAGAKKADEVFTPQEKSASADAMEVPAVVMA